MLILRSHTRRVTRVALAAALAGVTSACGSSTPAGPSVTCSFSLSASSQAFSSEGGAGTVSVATGSTCAWSVSGIPGWVTLVSSASATGPATVSFSVSRNDGQAAREQALTIAGQPFAVRQDAAPACTVVVAPDRREFTRHGGTAQVAVTAPAGCAWSASSQAPWIALTAGADGRGPGTVTYVVAENDGTSARSGTVAVSGQVHTVEQQGETALDCDYQVGPVNFTPCMAAGTLTARVTTQASCTWTAAPDEAWLAVIGGRSGRGSGTITFTYTDNYLAPRDGVVKVRWPTPSLGQNLHVAQAGCRYGVSRSAIDVPAAGGASTFDVLQQSDPTTCGGPLQDRCVWTARADVAWITVTSSMPRSGDAAVSFTVAVNAGTASRTGHIRVGDRSVTVTQAAP